MSKMELEAWKQRTDWQRPEQRGVEDKGGKKGKGLAKEQVWMTHGQLGGIDCGSGGWEEQGRGKGENWDNSNRTTVKNTLGG